MGVRSLERSRREVRRSLLRLGTGGIDRNRGYGYAHERYISARTSARTSTDSGLDAYEYEMLSSMMFAAEVTCSANSDSILSPHSLDFGPETLIAPRTVSSE